MNCPGASQSVPHSALSGVTVIASSQSQHSPTKPESPPCPISPAVITRSSNPLAEQVRSMRRWPLDAAHRDQRRCRGRPATPASLLAVPVVDIYCTGRHHHRRDRHALVGDRARGHGLIEGGSARSSVSPPGRTGWAAAPRSTQARPCRGAGGGRGRRCRTTDAHQPDPRRATSGPSLDQTTAALDSPASEFTPGTVRYKGLRVVRRPRPGRCSRSTTYLQNYVNDRLLVEPIC